MKDGKYEYKIEINKSITASSNEPISYDFRTTKDISLYIEEGKALITFTMTIKKEIDSYTDSRNYLFRDALRKAYLYHAFKYDRGLSVESITIHIEGETKVFDDKTPYFPFLQSLISTEALDLSAKWKSNDFCNKVLDLKTSQAYEDLKLPTTYSYLASKSKEHQIDRFSCLWTAMNAFYNFFITAKYGERKSDKESIELLIQKLSCGQKIPSKKEVEKNNILYMQACSYIAKLDIKQEQYEQFLSKKNEMTKSQSKSEDYADALDEMSGTFQISKYGLMVFTLPYFWRCKFLHGNHSTLLFYTHDDWHIAVLKNLNYFLDRFLNDNIPKMFDSNFINLIE